MRKSNPKRASINRAILSLLGAISICIPAAVAAAAPASKAEPGPPVFVTSTPIDAVVVIDGKTQHDRTPMLLRNLAAGKHRIVVARKGYAPHSGTLVVGGTKALVFHAALAATSFVPHFGADERVVLDGKPADTSAGRYRLPNGQYQVDRRNGVLTVDPVFPAQQIMNLVDLTTGGFAVASVILLGSAIFNNHNSASSNGGNGGAIAVWSITGLSALTDALLHVQKSRFLKANAPVPIKRSRVDAEQTYRKAQDLLANGGLQSAAEDYIQIIRDKPDSVYYPRALYQLAKIHAIEGDSLLATAELNLILEKYPLPDLYDKSCKSLADISFRAHDYRQAIAYLEKMVFLDPLFSRKQIEEYRASIEQTMRSAGASS